MAWVAAGLHVLQGTFDKRRHRGKEPSTSAPTPRAPSGLSAEARRLWREVNSEWELTVADRAVLHVGLQTLDPLRQAQEAIATDGLIYSSGKGKLKRIHPATRIEREARTAFLVAWRQLGLEGD